MKKVINATLVIGLLNLVACNPQTPSASDTSVELSEAQKASKKLSVSLVSPLNSQVFTAPATVTYDVKATDGQNSIVSVSFYLNYKLVETKTSLPYTHELKNLEAGSYTLFASATNNRGATKNSNIVGIRVNAPTLPNIAPSVQLTSPSNNSSLNAPASFSLSASASDSDGSISEVAFYQGPILLGKDPTAPYSYSVSNLPAGSYSFSAVAKDNLGLTKTSALVALTVAAAPNIAPSVQLTSPSDNSSFNAPASFSLSASASDSDGSISEVAFYQGTTLLGKDLTAPYSYSLSNLAVGNYSFTAVAKDNLGATKTSAITTILVQDAINLPGWYVDNAVAVSGDGTSWAKAWKSLAAINWDAISPGQKIFISGGSNGSSKVYAEAQVYVSKSGLKGSPITIGLDAGNPAHNGTVIVEGNGFYVPRNYISFNGNVGGESRMEFRNMTNSVKEQGRAITSWGNPTTGIEVSFVTFRNVNNGVVLNSSGGIFDFSIHDNKFFQMKGDAVIGVAGSKGGWDQNKIYNNYLEVVAGNGGGPDGIQVGDGTSIYNNKFMAVAGSPAVGQHPDYIQAVGSYMKVYGNEFVNIGDSAIDLAGAYSNPNPHDILIYNNVFRIETQIDPYPEYIRVYSTSGHPLLSMNNFKIFNNTFMDNHWSAINFGGYQANPTAVGNEIKNNIFFNIGNGNYPTIMEIQPSSGFTANSFSFDGNLYFDSKGPSYAKVSMFGNRQEAQTWVTNNEPSGSLIAPVFKSYTKFGANNDLRLDSSCTGARDQGVSLTNYTTIDKLNNPRGPIWDIGAFEYIAP